MTDDMIRSMKGQMVPSDDVVSDLLAKIAALDASPETSEHVVSFDDAKLRRACEDLTASQRPAAKAKKHTTKSIWYYSTAAVAGVIVLLSTITLFGDAEGGKAGDFIHSAINDQTVVTSPVDPNADTPVVTDPAKPDDRIQRMGLQKQTKTKAVSCRISSARKIMQSRRIRLFPIRLGRNRQARIRAQTTAAPRTLITPARRFRRLTMRITAQITAALRVITGITAIPVPSHHRRRMTATATTLSATAR